VAFVTTVGVAPSAWGHSGAFLGTSRSDPDDCFKTGASALIFELRDSDADGIGDTQITNDKIEGETIYYQATLGFTGGGQCGYEGGAVCIDPPGAVGCTDVTPLGGVPKICIGCIDPPGVSTVDSAQVAYVVSFADRDIAGICADQLQAFVSYTGGISHFLTDGTAAGSASICNLVTTPTPTPTLTPTPTPTDTPTPTPTDTPTPTPTETPTPTPTPTDTPTPTVTPTVTETPTPTPTPTDTPTPTPTDTPTPTPTDTPTPTPTDTPTPTPTDTPTPTVTESPTPTITTSPTPVPGHFQCYEVDRQAFPTISGITLLDAFGSSTVDVRRFKRFCAPANKNGEDPAAPTRPGHLAGYEITHVDPRFQARSSQTVTNQFGTIVVDVIRPDILMVPSAKSLISSPPELDPLTIDHMTCYRVKRGRTRVPNITVQDQFGTLTVDIKRPVRLCIATDKNGEGIPVPGAQTMCYEVRPARSPRFKAPNPLFINNQFGPMTIDITRPTELCVPSIASTPPPFCGDDRVDATEVCDPPGSACPDQQLCTNDCTCPPPLCGNGTVDTSEQCDPSFTGNPTPCPGDTACQADCTCPPVCGNGILEPGEDCDPPSTGQCAGPGSFCDQNCLCQID
jgi:hypothetical protein